MAYSKIMNLMDIHEVEPEEYVQRNFDYPVYVHLKGANLYIHKSKRTYQREDFHTQPEAYECLFEPYCAYTDILMNGIYWDKRMPRLFEAETMQNSDFNIQTIADITDDAGGSIPCNLGDATIAEPVYGVDKMTNTKTAPYLSSGVDVVAVGNLPNELPGDASRYFGDQLIKYVLDAILKKEHTPMIERATILNKGQLTERFDYLQAFAAH